MQFSRFHSYCGRSGLLACLLLLAPVMAMAGQKLDMSLAPWLAISDNVMGGVSSGQMTQTEAGLRFEGRLSLENNGGFASVRRPVDGGLAGISGIRIKVRGDGRRYQLRMRHGRQFDGVSWRAMFTTTSEWKTIDISLADFEPVFRGNAVPGAGPLVPEQVGQLGFLLADGRDGRFELDIAAIEFTGPGSWDTPGH